MSEFREPSPELRARVAMQKHRFHTTHSLGQNFILDGGLVDHLLDAANVCAEENVLEIGPGAGVMTCKLAARAAKVLAVEVDNSLQPVLEEVLAGVENAQVVYQDIMKADLSTLTREAFGDEPYRVVANLPYYITADIMLKLTAAQNKPESICIMVQKEAADRMMSVPGEKRWCALAATMQFYGELCVLMDVPPEVFVPRPHVMSCFIRIDMYSERPVEPKDERTYIRLINAAFAMRRKTLVNNLKSSFGLDAAAAKELLVSVGFDEKVRGESLTLAELCRIADALSTKI